MNSMNPEQMLDKLIEFASLTPEQKILVEFPYSDIPDEHKSILITVSGRLTFIQLNEQFYFDEDQMCSGHYPISADHALDLIKFYSASVFEFITKFFEGHPTPTPASVMDHREYAHLEKMINDQLDAAQHILDQRAIGEYSSAYLSVISDKIRIIKSMLQIHPVKDPYQKPQPTKSILPLAKQWAQDA